MIKFFRKIRKNLLNEGKTSKYFKYAIGEIILVVIGILIALQINNWNQSRIQYISETEFIKSVKNDIKQDKAYIQRVIATIEPKIAAYKALNKLLQNLYQNDRKILDSLFRVYFQSQRTFYPISGSYESGVSGNEITHYRNKALVQKLTKLYNSTYDRLIDNGRMFDERWDFLTKKYSHERRTGHFRKSESEQLSEFLDDLYYHYIQMEWYRKQLLSTIVVIDEIISGN